MRNGGWEARTRLLWAKDEGGKRIVIGDPRVRTTILAPPAGRAKMKAYIYINPNAPAEVKRFGCGAFFRCQQGEFRIHAGGHGRLRGCRATTICIRGRPS